jgi:hypothetical protein
MHPYRCTHIYIDIDLFMNIYICIHACAYLYRYISIEIHIDICIYICATGVRIILATCSDDLVGACLGKIAGSIEQKALYRILAQAHFLLTGHCGVSVEGFDSILLRVEPEENPAVNTSRCAALWGDGGGHAHWLPQRPGQSQGGVLCICAAALAWYGGRPSCC